MFDRGFAAVGMVRTKDKANAGHVLRAAACYGVRLVAFEGARTCIRTHVDTCKTYRHTPVIRVDALRTAIPFDTVPIAVDLVTDAESLVDFAHPARAFYIFGPEDGTLGRKHLEWCQRRVMLPTEHCMNLAAAVNVV